MLPPILLLVKRSSIKLSFTTVSFRCAQILNEKHCFQANNIVLFKKSTTREILEVYSY